MALKTKKVLDAQAQAAIASGIPADVVISGLESRAVNEDETSPPPAPAPEETEAAPAPAPEETEAAPAEASAQPVITQLLAQMKQASDDLVAVKVELAQAKLKASAYEADHDALIRVAAQATQKLHVGLGGPAPALESLTALGSQALLAQYDQLVKQLNTRMPVGQVFEQREEEDEAGQAVMTAAQYTNQVLMGLAKI